MGEYSKALSFDERALKIRQQSLPPNHPDLTASYNNIGLVYDKMGDYSKALSSHEKALEIR
jgi:tetratricopeptide (TPR) repeat protein